MIIKYKYLVWLRIILAVLPLYGYIHPDEYFQSVEIVTGDILNVEVHRTWEFVEARLENFIRSMVFPYITVGTPVYILKIISDLSVKLFGMTLITPNSVLLSIRLTYCALSFIIDLCLKRICEREGKNPEKYLSVLGTSYVMLVMVCRTFSNSVEAVLLAILIDVATGRIGTRYQRQELDGKTTRKLILMSFVLVGGFFNRPTFLFFALAPGLTWLLFAPYLQLRLWSMVKYCILTVVLFIIFDTKYYIYYNMDNFLTYIFMGWIFLVVTPWNFISYNLNPGNLAEHGVHSRFTHLLFNEPLLFGPLSFGLWTVVDLFRYKRTNVFSVKFFFKAFVFTPLLFYSFFSHQEPRFLTALILPVVFLNANRVMSSKILFKAWISFNIVLIVVFGMAHQGGVIPSLKYVYDYKVRSGESGINVVYYHTYMPPRFLLLNEKSYNSSSNVTLHDLMGTSGEHLEEFLKNFEKTILVSPTSLRKEIQDQLKGEFQVTHNTTFRTHISFEDLPVFNSNFFWNLGLDVQTVSKISLETR